ncbi:hypothetical protein SOVF_069770, partial [Spinacia oleracea]
SRRPQPPPTGPPGHPTTEVIEPRSRNPQQNRVGGTVVADSQGRGTEHSSSVEHRGRGGAATSRATEDSRSGGGEDSRRSSRRALLPSRSGGGEDRF